MASGKLKLGLMATAASALFGVNVNANAQNEADGSAADAGGVTDQIIVRAQRREQSIVDVPAQVTSMSAEALIDNDVLTLEDIGDRIPSTYIGSRNGYGSLTFSIRGVSSNALGETPVAIFFDDQFIPRNFSGAILDLESVEVLRGPQATLYGRNATGGAILLRSKRPNFGEVDGYVRAQYAQHGEMRVETAIGGGLTDNFAVRIAALYADREGWATNTVNGDDFDRAKTRRVRGSFLWEPTDRLEIYGVGEVGDEDFSIARATLAADRMPGGNRRIISDAALDNLRDGNFASDALVDNALENARASFSVNYDFGGFDLFAQVGYFYHQYMGANDSDGSAVDLLSNNGLGDGLTYTQDLRLVSTGDRRFEWIIGFSGIQDRNSQELFQIFNTSAFGGAGGDFRFSGRTNSKAYAFFAEATYRATDRLSLTFGGRYTTETKTASIQRQFFNMTTGLPSGPPATLDDEVTFNAFKPRGIVEYAVSDDINLYASVGTGFKAGGYNLFAPSLPVDEENIIAYEAGLKANVLNGRLFFSGAGFYNDYSDLQLRLGVPAGGVITQNAADARIFGFEAEANYSVTDALTLFGNFSVLDTEFKEYITRDLAGNLIDAAGNELARAPNFSINAGFEYETSITNDLFARLGGSISHRSEVFFLETDQDAPTFRGKPLTDLNFRLTVGRQDGRVEVAAFVQNVLDQVEVANTELQGNFPVASFTEPRKAGVELIARF